MNYIRFVKDWALPISMLTGVASYFIYVNIHALDFTHEFVLNVISNYIQPMLIFCMLFVSFCKVKLKELKPCKWMIRSLLLQTLSFVGLGLLIIAMPDISGKVVIESAMLCMICPTATAAAVVTSKLNGNSSAVVSYTCLINLMVSVVVPAIVPLLHETHADLTFWSSFFIILRKVFPTLIFPLVFALMLQKVAPKIHAKILSHKNLAFDLWIVALALAIGITVKAIVHTDETVYSLIGIAIASLICCLIQFITGRYIGEKYGETIAGTQTLGQKNTVFAIWMGATFMNPVTSTAGGFYSVWHNIFNSYQLYKARKDKKIG